MGWFCEIYIDMRTESRNFLYLIDDLFNQQLYIKV